MAKVQIKSEKITPFGGIFHVRELFSRFLGPVIDKVLGLRCTSFGYQYGEHVLPPSSQPQTADGYSVREIKAGILHCICFHQGADWKDSLRSQWYDSSLTRVDVWLLTRDKLYHLLI
ncbi:MAG: hypothetical protein II484_01270 [Bacteroidaceae bacterium]|nr:hypothetical protein [Bacteroidaceae bacterium]